MKLLFIKGNMYVFRNGRAYEVWTYVNGSFRARLLFSYNDVIRYISK